MNMISVAVLLMVSAISQTNADCCVAPVLIHHVCMDIPWEKEMPFHKYLGIIDENDYWVRHNSDEYKIKCESLFCGDGYKMQENDFYCGNGECNVFGCNCDGGCRSKENVTEETITNDFVEKYGFKYQAQHRFFKLKLWKTTLNCHLTDKIK